MDPPELKPVPRRRLAQRPAPPAPIAPAAEPMPPAARPPRSAAFAIEEELPPIERVPRDGPLPASFLQQWAWDWLKGKPTADLNIPCAVSFPGPLSLPALHAALHELCRRQEGLRTRLVRTPGEPWTIGQRIDPPGRLAVPLVDLSRLGPTAGARERGRLALEDAERPRELTGPLLRVLLVRLGETDSTLFLNLCHLIADGGSVELLRGELSALYDAFAAGWPSPLPELPVQFADFAVWQRRIASGALVSRQLDYWRRRLDALPDPLVLTGDWPHLPPGGRGTVLSRCGFPPAVAVRLRGFARAERATPALLLLTAFELLLSAYTGETDLVVESMVFGRSRPELAAIVGLFINTLPHRTDLAGRPSFAEALRRTRDGVLEDYCHQDVSYPRLLLELYPGRRLLSRVGFNMLSFPAASSHERRDREEAIFSYEGRGPDMVAPKYDILALGHEDRDHLELELVGTANRFNGETMADIAADLTELLVRALDDSGAPVCRLLPRPRYRHVVASLPNFA